jgi:hypothetical protein
MTDGSILLQRTESLAICTLLEMEQYIREYDGQNMWYASEKREGVPNFIL